MVKFRVVLWLKHFGNGSNESVSYLLLNIQDSCVEKKSMVKLNLLEWIPPVGNVLKFNVDGSVRGKNGHVGIGGLLRISNGKIPCSFASFVGIQETNYAELMAIQKDVNIVVSNPSLKDRQVVVVSDSKMVVSWINNDGFRNVNLVNSIYDFVTMLTSMVA
ncbi:hypothetical protein Ddye_006863 [Dipteronia dyeriana]|uniref:RNase H type-1 domain-containing protein n=1 Tax=Dipteronia dyeriana TaxID=168575 RepID=A0AAD9XIY1_9ROSI|nr:hypothetical protein Ddye_006863 [Dipteronia dyeriana]